MCTCEVTCIVGARQKVIIYKPNIAECLRDLKVHEIKEKEKEK